MKKLAIVLLLMICSLGVFAQDGTWYFSFMPGYQFGSSWSNTNAPSGKVDYIKAKTSLVTSFDGEYLFTDNFGLHMGLIYDQGKFSEKWETYSWNGTPSWRTGDFDNSYGIFEIGPEYLAPLGKNDQIYFQANVGGTFTHTYLVDGSKQNNFHLKDGLTYGAAVGYRHFFNERTGLAVQVAYHKIDAWRTSQMDTRIGVVFRF